MFNLVFQAQNIKRNFLLQEHMRVNVYGFNKTYIIKILHKQFYIKYIKGYLKTSHISIIIGKKKISVTLRTIFLHTFSSKPIHCDFQIINYLVPIKFLVKIKVLNVDICPGLKKGGVINLVKRDIVLLSPPNNAPLFLKVDIRSLEIGDSVTARNLRIPYKTVTKQDSDFLILKILGRTGEEEKTDT